MNFPCFIGRSCARCCGMLTNTGLHLVFSGVTGPDTRSKMIRKIEEEDVAPIEMTRIGVDQVRLLTNAMLSCLSPIQALRRDASNQRNLDGISPTTLTSARQSRRNAGTDLQCGGIFARRRGAVIVQRCCRIFRLLGLITKSNSLPAPLRSRLSASWAHLQHRRDPPRFRPHHRRPR